MSKTSEMVFAAYMQHCIQSTVAHLTHVKGVEDTMYSVCSGLCIQCPPCQEGRLFLTVQYFKSLLSWGFSSSPLVSPGRRLC